MTLATLSGGNLIPMDDCFIEVGDIFEEGLIKMKVLPEISDQKSAEYNDEAIIGRTQPLKTYSHSANRVISWTIHLIVVEKNDIERNIKIMRVLESLTYPRSGGFATSGAPFLPPQIIRIKCGQVLAKEPLCVVLKSYNVKFATDVAWFTDEKGLSIPGKIDIDLNFEVVYDSADLPGQSKIIESGGSPGGF